MPVTAHEDGTVSEALRKVRKRVQAALVTLNGRDLDSHQEGEVISQRSLRPEAPYWSRCTGQS